MTGILYHDDFLAHNTGIGHPERPARLTAIIKELKKDKYAGKLVWDEPRLAELDEIARVHSEDYIEHVRKTCERAPANLDSPDTPVSKQSWQAALRASGAVMSAIDGVMEGRYASAFCPVRPPGHHSTYSMAMGFCIFNNIAIGARYLKEKYNILKILIVDFDIHHCNGTESMLGGDTDILLCSFHQHPNYPGTGLSTKLYSHSGGVLNSPLPPGSGEAEYMKVMKGQLADQVNMFMPEFVMISAGFDAHKNDPLGDIYLESESYYRLTHEIVKFANMYCDGKTVSVLEGGYDLKALEESSGFHVDGLLEAGA